MNKLSLTCYGGVGSVTGANFLLAWGERHILVDCGLVQGGEFAKEENKKPFAYNPAKTDTLIVTHAHMDHIGRIPKLVQEGFSGKIISTPSTKELAEIMLIDSMGVLARQAEEKGEEPLYTKEDVVKALSLWETTPYHTNTDMGDGFSFIFKDAGHILGSAIVTITAPNGKKIVFSGDLGNSPAPLLRETESITEADYIVMESVYGDRVHEARDTRSKQLEEIIAESIQRGGALMIPAFSIERTQTVLYEINKLIESGKIPHVPVFLDSPLAIKVTDIYKHRSKNFNEDVRGEIQDGDDIFDFPNFTATLRSRESHEIDAVPNPKIIIAGSGMSNGGRIVRHEQKYLPDPSSTILFLGFQAAETLGRKILEGNKEVMINNEKVPVKARVEVITGYSGHADRDGLLAFVEPVAEQVRKVFVTMGEPKASLFLVQRLRDYLGVDAVYPEAEKEYVLE
ncbi:MAG: MBL fold metallo-hydrolase [Candidatus Paceibacterota bacterium]